MKIHTTNKLSIWLTYSLCGLLSLQPALANVVIDNRSGNTSKTQAGNGVEVVNIAPPNNKGLSHNQYKKFDVEPQGLILNNSIQPLSRSQLGGILQNNPNLNGQAANVILNEVTGANRSQLEGYTEVFGQQANVILANPYGITCNGCGFINTPRVTLSTGAPDIQDGLVSGFDVAEGSVTIEGLGLDASQQTYFDIITRTAEINANIHANGLTLVTGTNHVGYQTNQATPTNTTSSGSKPALAIDSSSLGGMYAGRISLVATEQGVGVNVGNLVSNIGDLSISSNGDIVLGNASSAQDLSLNTLQNLTLADTQTAQKDASLTAQRIQVEQSQIVVDGTLSLHTDNLTLTDTDIETQQIETEIHDITVDEQSKMSAASITMAELSSLNNHGQVYARDTLSIQGHSTRLTEDGLLTASNVIIQSPQLTIDTRLQTDNTQIVSSQQLIITDDAQLEATGDVELTSELLDLIGDTVANNQIDIAVNDAANIRGTLIGKNVNLAANDAQVQGALHANEVLTVTAETLTNTGSMTSSNSQQINVDSNVMNSGWVYATDSLDFRVQGTLLNQQGEILSNGDIQIRGRQGNELAQNFNNASGALHANQNLAIYASTILNKPTTVDFNSDITNGDYAFGSVEGFSVGWGSSYTPATRTEDRNCNAFGRSCEHWKVSQDKEVTLLTQTTNRTLTSNASSQMTADGSITLVSEKITNELGLIHAGQDLDISTEALVNRGYTTGQYRDYSLYKHYRTEGDPIHQFDYIRLNTQTQTLNEETHHSTIAAGGSVTIDADSLVNNSDIREMDASDITGLAAQPIQQQTAATLAYPIPSGANGLFIDQPDPLGKYLIETNPLLTNMGQFLGSDYFINRVGFNPQTDVKFLGDAFYDSKIISQAIFEQTGLRYLNQSIGSQLEQMQQLIDAAALQKNALNLSAGVALSADQIANLTQDIMWYEEVVIDGQTVLAPKLYLAQVTLDNLSQGAIIAATDVTLNADNMTNSGRVSADSSLNLTSAHSIDNLAGTLTSNGNLSLLAEQDIINLGGDIQGDNASLTTTRGDIVNQTLTTTLTSTLGSSSSTLTKLGKAASIRASGDLALNAGNNIKNLAADISSQGNLDLTAGQSLIVSAKENTLNASGSFDGEASTSRIGSSVTAEGNISLNAGKDITITASQLASQQTLSLEAGNNVTVEAALNEQSDNTHLTNYTSINRSEQHQGSTLKGNDVTVKASNDATLSGSAITAEQSAAIEAKGDVNILAVNDSQYHYDQTISNKSFGRSKTTTNETYREQVKGSAIQAGQDVRVNAQNLDTVITAGGDSDINLIGSELSAGGQVELSADGDVKLAAQTYKQFERHETIKKGFGGLSGRNQGSLDDATLLNSSYLINSGNTSITAGRDIGVIASEVTSGGEVNLNAVEDVLIAAGDVLKKSQQWDEKMSFLSGGNLFEMEKKRQGEETSTAQSSSIQSGGSLTVNAGSVKVVGSELNTDHNVSLTADTGDVEILAAKETTKAFESEEKLSISLGDGLDGVSVEDGQIKISLGDASYDKVKQQSDALNHKESVVKAQNDLAVNAESSILVEGSTLASDSDGNHQGDLSLTAKDDVTIKEAVDTLSEQREEIHGKAEASLVVQHQAVEVAKAALALKEATKKLKQAKADFKQYKKGLDSLEATLATLEQEYKAKKPGVIYEDIEELQDLVSEVKSDEAWYVAGVALATENVASKTTLLVQQTAAAAQSTGTYGFNAGLHLDIEASKTQASSQQTTSVGSQLSGENIVVRAGNREGNQANISGSTLAANDNLEIAANEITITSSQDTQNSKSETQSGQIGASMTVYWASTGINLNASFDRNQSTSSSVTHNNSQLNADNITITSTQDTNIKGATVAANDSLTVDVGGNLNVASVQDRHSSSQKGMGISGGLSLSGGQTADGNGALPEGTLNSLKGAGNLTGASGGFNTSNGRTRTKQTVLTSLNSGGSADITVANNTNVKGALIATTDENGQDSGELNLTTGSLTFADLSNTSYNQNRSMGLNTSVGVNDGELDSTNNSTSVQYKNTSGYSKSKTLATIGQGQLTIADSENSDDTSRLNRDTEHTEKDLFTVDRKKGDIDVTVDHRLLTEDGRKAIAKDVETTHEAGQDVYRAAETYVNSDNMDLFDFGKSVSDNRKVTELKNELLSSQEGLDLLNDLKSTDPDKVLAAQAEISKKAQEKYGLEPEQVNFYDADKTTSVAMKDNDVRDVHGGVVTDDDHELHGEVNVDVSDATTKTELLNTLGHETYESITENTTGEQTAAQEDLAKSFGNQLEDRVNQAAGGDLDSTVGDNWNSSLVNSSTTQLGTERVNKVGNVNVDYYLTPKQQESKQQELSGCGNDNRCQIDVVRKYGAIDAGQEFERDSAKYGQLAENIKDGVTNVVDAVSSPIDTVSGWIDSLKGVTPESVAEAVNAGADNQHQTLVDRDQAFINGDSEKLGKAEGDIATEYLSTQSVPGGAGVVGKIIDKLDGKSTVIPSDTSSVRSQVLENIEKNKAAKPTDNFKVYASKEKARQFYLDQGWEGKWIDSHLEGIDFTKPVSVETLKSGEQVYQWQVPNAQQGNYYTPDKVTQPDELGINPQAIHRGTGELVDKVQSPYKVNKDVKVLQSTAREIEDTWSVPDEPYNTSGGGTQLFTSDKASLEKLEE